MQVRDYYKDKTILLTGASGYIGKIILLKLITACTDINKIYLLIRKKEGVTLQQRLKKEIFNSIMFKEVFLNNPHLEALAHAKTIPIAGDIDKPNLGMED